MSRSEFERRGRLNGVLLELLRRLANGELPLKRFQAWHRKMAADLCDERAKGKRQVRRKNK